MINRILAYMLFAWMAIILHAQTTPAEFSEYHSRLSVAKNAFNNKDYELAISEYQRILAEMNLSYDSESAIFYHMGICYRELKKYDQAVAYLSHADSIEKQDAKGIDIFRCLIDEQMTKTFIEMRNLDEAEKWAKLSLDHNLRYFKTESVSTINAIYDLYLVYLLKGNDALAAKYLWDFIDLSGKTGNFDLQNVNSVIKPLIELGTLYNKLNKCDMAFPIFALADTLLCEINNHHPLRINTLNNLCSVSLKLGNPNIAKSYLEIALKISNSIPENEIDDLDLLNLYNIIALTKMEDDPNYALNIFEKILNLYNSKGKDKNSLNYALLLSMLSSMSSDPAESIQYSHQATEIAKRLHNVDVSLFCSIFVTHINKMFADITKYQNEIVQSAHTIQDYLSLKLYESFPFLTENERTLYWSQVRNWYQNILPKITNIIGNSSMLTLCYNGMLQSRGILLYSNISIENLIRESANPILKNTYKQLTVAKERYGGLYDPIIESLERKVLQQIPQYGDFMEVFNVNTDSVRLHLNPDDVAIEFIRIDDINKDDSITSSILMTKSDNRHNKDNYKDSTCFYVALVLKAYYQTPKIIYLCQEKDFYFDSDHDLYYKKIWEPLEKEIEGAERILFSPDGRLFALPIEYSISPSGKCMMDNYICCRVSSTRELVSNKSTSGNNAILYGGIKYDIAVNEMIADAQKYRTVTLNNVKERGSRGAIIGIDELPATMTEVKEIARLISETPDCDITVQLFCGKDATEASFKAQSGKQNRIIHISTHGFYDEHQNDNILITGQSDIVLAEESALCRSGLLFAGVDNVRFGEPIPRDVEDGVMNAYEISHLDLHKTDMVVLSACQSAQGDITGDGIFGLQRGFKKAGAKSILMSLWKVDDDATCMLMTEFYRNWIAMGKTKHDALKLAKETVRNQSGWEDPKYWAAFILLDGLD